MACALRAACEPAAGERRYGVEVPRQIKAAQRSVEPVGSAAAADLHVGTLKRCRQRPWVVCVYPFPFGAQRSQQLCALQLVPVGGVVAQQQRHSVAQHSAPQQHALRETPPQGESP